MIRFLSLTIVLPSLIFYLPLTFLGNHFWVWQTGFFLSVISLVILVKKNIPAITTLKFNPQFLIFGLTIIVYIFAKAIVLSPVILTVKQDNFEHIQITDVGDYYKHIFVTLSLSKDGVPPNNPYFPPAKLSYYWGFYFIPASLSRIFGIPPNISFYAFALTAILISQLIFLTVIYESFKKFYLRFITFLLVIFGSGIDVLSISFLKLNFLKSFGETVLKQGGENGIQLINTYKAVLFVPQHFFAAAITVAVTYWILKCNKDWIFLGLCWAFVFLSSFFVFPTLFIWTLTIFLFKKETRIIIVKSAALALLIILPYFLQIAGRENSIYFYLFKPYEFFADDNFFRGVFNFAATFLIFYGPVLIVIPLVFISFGKKFVKKNLLYAFLAFTPILTTWFIRTPLYNDFSLRSMIPVQIIAPFFLMKLYDEEKQRFARYFILSTAIFALIISMAGFYFEYLRHWQNRSFLHPRDSELILKLRDIDPDIKLSAVDRGRWVEFIPSLGFKQVLSPYLFDSYNYISGDITQKHAEYENIALGLFINEAKGRDLESLVSQQNTTFGNLEGFFNSFESDKLVINNQIWYKKDVNPWIEVFNQLEVKGGQISPGFSFFDTNSLKNKLAKKRIFIDKENLSKINISGASFPLSKALWFITSCKTPGISQLKLELEDYYLLFNIEGSDKNEQCAGKLFYLQSDENIRVDLSSTIKGVTVFPVIISSKN